MLSWTCCRAKFPIPVLKRLGIEMKIDLKILSATIKTPVSDENRYQKLMVVERYLERQSMIGTLAKPGGYFRGRMPMKYGVYHEASEGGISYRGFERFCSLAVSMNEPYWGSADRPST